VLKSLSLTSASLFIFLSLSAPALANSSLSVAQAQQVEPSSETDISSEELEQFAAAIQEMRSIQMESRNEVSQAIEEEGLSAQRFREILQAQRNPEMETDASEAELQKFESASQKLAQIQRDTQSEMKQAVESQGLEVPRFQQILGAVRQQPELRQQVQQIIQSNN